MPTPTRQRLQGLTYYGRRRALATSSFRFIGSPEARNRSRYRYGASIGRSSDQRFGVTHAIRQSSAYYGPGRSVALPAIYQWPDTAEEGGFIAYGPRFAKLYERLAQQAAKLLRGIKVADIPVEQPTKFELAINLKTAKALGLTIRESLLARADEVIE